MTPLFEAQFGKGHLFERVIIPEGIAIAKRWEVEKLEVYRDYNGQLAVYFGHSNAIGTLPLVTDDMVVGDSAEAHRVLLNDMETVARTLRKWITVEVTTPMFNALILLAMNAGLGNVRDGATNAQGEKLPSVLTALNEERHSHACARFFNHRFAGKPTGEIVELVGLINRRADEMSLFLTKKEK